MIALALHGCAPGRSVERLDAEVRSNISQIQYLYIDIDF